ncbi:MAG: DUF2892 domain-containing protein [Bacteroides graminisolvens]|uniref:YgaP family membrane protein n=1 Tax=Bacteroides graminisolvens TaxID=477666 RepID=UPI003A850A3C
MSNDKDSRKMKERIVRFVAGAMILVSVALAYFVALEWLFLTLFVGVNLLQSSITKFCPLELIIDYFTSRSQRAK